VQPTDGLVHIDCSAPDALKAAAPILDKFRAFEDAQTLAGQTSRNQLAGVIQRMQQARRDFEDISVPVCAVPLTSAVTTYMSDSINVFIAFLGQENTAALVAKKMVSDTEAARLLNELFAPKQ